MKAKIYAALFISAMILCQTLLSEYGSPWGNNGYNMVFKPNGGYAAVGNVSYENGDDGTFEAWVYNTGSSTRQAIIAKGSSLSLGFIFGITSNVSLSPNRLFLYMGNNNNIWQENTNGIQIPLNKWTHVAVSWKYDGLPNTFAIKFYVDGALSGSVLNASGGWGWGLNSDSVTIGLSKSLFASDFKGYLDEVRMWSKDIPQDRIARNRFIGLGNYNQANNNNAITSSTYYKDLLYVWDFNNPLFSSEIITQGNQNAYYRGNSFALENLIAGQPLPYNMVLKVDDIDDDDYVKVSNNAVFNEIDNYTVESWVYVDSLDVNAFKIIGKGNWGYTFPNFYDNVTFELYVYENHVTFRNRAISASYFGFPGGVLAEIPNNRWFHVAAVWEGSGTTHLAKLYINGEIKTLYSITGATVPTNSDPVKIGSKYTYSNVVSHGYIDEARYWNKALTPAEIRKYMLRSCRDISDPAMVGAWNFDGNHENIGSGSSPLDGSFNTGGDNKHRFSGYKNEQAAVQLSTQLNAHPTVLGLNLTGGLPSGDFFRGVSQNAGPIPQGVVKTYSIWVSEDQVIDNVTVLVSLQHPTTSELTLTLKAPNGQYKVLHDNNGSNGNDILTVYSNGAGNSITNAEFLAPWSEEVIPVSTGAFRCTSHGFWTLEVKDEVVNAAEGYFIDWGLRFNSLGDRPAGENTSPYKFNLSQNYPNPFNPVTDINYSLAKDIHVKITLYDILGRETKVLIDEFKQAGIYNFRFDSTNLASGVYFYRITAGDFTDIKKMILAK